MLMGVINAQKVTNVASHVQKEEGNRFHFQKILRGYNLISNMRQLDTAKSVAGKLLIQLTVL